jgi:hypothetical protein
MNKRTISRAVGFVAAMGATAGLVGVGVNMTGAYFQDSETGNVRAATGEVDLAVDQTTPLMSNFGPLLPGGSDSNTYTLTNTGTGPVDFYLSSLAWDSHDENIVTLDLDADNDNVPDNAAGISSEFSPAGVDVANGDVLSFEYRLGEGQSCAGGVPRVFIQGGAYNTFDVDPAGPLACGTDTDGDGWSTVTQTLSGITAGPIGLVAYVNDQTANPGKIEYRALTLNNVDLNPGPHFNECVAGDHQLLVSLDGPSYHSGALDLCNLPTTMPALAAGVQPGDSADLSVTIALQGTAGNRWANKVGTAQLVAVATQAGQAPTFQADQTGNDDA